MGEAEVLPPVRDGSGVGLASSWHDLEEEDPLCSPSLDEAINERSWAKVSVVSTRLSGVEMEISSLVKKLSELRKKGSTVF